MNLSYAIPIDKEQLMFDFYMMEFISHQVPVDEKLTYSFKETRAKLLTFLKDEFLDIILFDIFRELRHVYTTTEEATAIEHKKNFLTGWNSSQKVDLKLQLQFNPRFVTAYNKARQKGIISHKETMEEVLTKSNTDKYDFIFGMQSVFLDFRWFSGYGGTKWANICKVWMRLDDSKIDDKDFEKTTTFWIDRIYDLEHNSGLILASDARYIKAKEGSSWIRKALDLKANTKTPWQIWNGCSSDMKKISAMLLKEAGFGTAEQFFKK